MPQTQRPARPQIQDFSGKMRTLLSGAEAFAPLWPEPAPASATLILLGLGPDPAEAARLFASWQRVFVVECPDFSRAMAWQNPPLPQGWQWLPPEEALSMVHTGFASGLPVNVISYTMGARLFPQFWGPLLGKLQALLPLQAAETPQCAAGPASHQAVWLPGQGLLADELRQAVLEAGLDCLNPPLENFAQFRAFARHSRLRICVSVNGRGLDQARFYLLQAMGVPVALWLVDNPWLILSAQKTPWWKEATLFVTDPTYLPELREQGAKNAHFLPLAASPLFRPLGSPPKLNRPLLFVGSSAFAGHNAYFAASSLPDTTAKAALALEKQGIYADFTMWCQALGVEKLWPGHDIRSAALGAQQSGLRRKAAWLAAAGPCTLIGDAGWAQALGHASHACELLPPVPYQELPLWYAAAPLSLSIGDLLLPGALNQRHFDVWQAGGFLLSAATPALDYFPRELAEPITLSEPAALQEAIAAWGKASPARLLLQAAWRNYLSQGQTYSHRLRLMMQQSH